MLACMEGFETFFMIFLSQQRRTCHRHRYIGIPNTPLKSKEKIRKCIQLCYAHKERNRLTVMLVFLRRRHQPSMHLLPKIYLDRESDLAKQ